MTICDATMYHMRSATVRDLRYHFSEVENLLKEGEMIQITKRKHVIAQLVPVQAVPPPRAPDFMARLKEMYGDKVMEISGAELIGQDRDRY